MVPLLSLYVGGTRNYSIKGRLISSKDTMDWNLPFVKPTTKIGAIKAVRSIPAKMEEVKNDYGATNYRLTADMGLYNAKALVEAIMEINRPSSNINGNTDAEEILRLKNELDGAGRLIIAIRDEKAHLEDSLFDANRRANGLAEDYEQLSQKNYSLRTQLKKVLIDGGLL